MFLLKEAMSLLAQTGTLPSKCKPHKLTGNYKDCWECHLRPDWLLVWKQNDKKLILLFTTGTHADLFLNSRTPLPELREFFSSLRRWNGFCNFAK